MSWNSVSFGQTCGATGIYKLYLGQDEDPSFFADIPAPTTSASFDLGTGTNLNHGIFKFKLPLFPPNSYSIFQAFGIGRLGPSTEHSFLLPVKQEVSTCADLHDPILRL